MANAPRCHGQGRKEGPGNFEMTLRELPLLHSKEIDLIQINIRTVSKTLYVSRKLPH